jgi:hypothetical protein
MADFFAKNVIRIVSGVIIVGAVTVLANGMVPAASRSTSSTTSSLNLSSTDPAYGSTITFTATYSSMKWIPEESVICTSNGQTVYGNVQVETSGSSPWTSSWKLWSQTWANAGGGPAACTAALYYYTWQGKKETGVVYLASSIFTAT